MVEPNTAHTDMKKQERTKEDFLFSSRSRSTALLGLRGNSHGREDDGLGTLLEKRVLGDGLEGLLDVDGLLGRGLKERDIALGAAPRLETLVETTRVFSMSILLPMTTNGKRSGSRGAAWMRTRRAMLSRLSKVLATFTSNTSTQQSAPR